MTIVIQNFWSDRERNTQVLHEVKQILTERHGKTQRSCVGRRSIDQRPTLQIKL